MYSRHLEIPAFGWICRGVKKKLKSNCGRERVNINGAIDIDTLQTVTDFAASIVSPSTVLWSAVSLSMYLTT